MERCGTALLDCILDCEEDGTCLSNCIRVEIECIDGESDILYSNVIVMLSSLT